MSGRYLYGETRPVVAPVLTAQAITLADLIALNAGNVIRAADVTWPSAVATPSAPTVTNTTTTLATGLTNAATAVKISYQFPWGEGALSNAGSATPTANAGLLLTGLAVPSPAIGVNVYVEDSAGSGTYKLYAQYAVQPGQQGIGNQLITGYGRGQAPPTAVTSGAHQIAQYNFAQAFLGASGSTKAAALARVVGFGEDNRCRVDTDGVWEYTLNTATTVKVGDFFGAAMNGSSDGLLSTTVASVVHRDLAIGQAVEAGTDLTAVKIHLLSTHGRGSR